MQSTVFIQNYMGNFVVWDIHCIIKFSSISRFGPYFVDPVVAYVDEKTGKARVANTDLIGCKSEPADFVVSGTGSEQLYGMCEVLWKPGLNADELFEVISQSLVNAFDRDALSGWGAEVYIM